MLQYRSRRAATRIALVAAFAVILGCSESTLPASTPSQGAVEAPSGVAPSTPHEAVEAEDLAAVRALLAGRADPNAQDADGSTPLHVAARRGLWPLVQELLEGGALASARDAEGRTPLHLAVLGDNSVRGTLALLSHGAKPGARDNHARPPTHGNVNRHNMRILIGHGADVTWTDDEGKTALHIAASYGRGGSMMVLTEKGADANALDNAGRTPLHFSALQRSGALFAVLKEANVDIDHQDESGSTALHGVAREGHRRLVRQLIEAGADWKLLDDEGRTAEQVAVELGRGTIVSMFRKLTRKPERRPRARVLEERIKDREGAAPPASDPG